MKKQMLAGYLVIRDGRTMRHGSVRCELMDDTEESREATCNWAADYVRSRWNLPNADQVKVVALFDTASLSPAKEM